MERLIDLHTHSIMSDGSMTPADLVKHAKECGLAAIALTDHDGIEGVREAIKTGNEIGIEVVSGIELSAQSATETHILGYDIDIENKELLDTLEQVKVVRMQRNVETLEKLVALGFDITMDEVAALAPNGLLARAHFAKVMAQKGYTKSVKESFDLYLSTGKPGYSSTQLLTSRECVELIKRAGGKAFVAHLHLIKLSDEDLVDFLTDLKLVGLDGIEGFYTEYTFDMQEKFQALAKELNLKISGGTDFHGAMKPHIAIGKGLGDMKIPYCVLEGIRE